VTVLGPANREAHVAAAEWTIAAEYLALKSVKVRISMGIHQQSIGI